MSSSIKKKSFFLDLLKVLKKMKPEERSKFVQYLNPEAVDFLCECFHNVLFTDLKVKNKSLIKKKLKSNCSVSRLKLIANKSKPYQAKIKALKQEGAGIGLILSAALPFLTSLFGR